MAEDDITPDPDTPEVPEPAETVGAVETADGVEHVGVLPASAAETVEEKRAARTGWYRSPGGHLAHADGPDQKRAFADRGWTEIGEDEAKQVIADGLTLDVDQADSKGTFDEDAVRQAVKDEGTGRARRPRRG